MPINKVQLLLMYSDDIKVLNAEHINDVSYIVTVLPHESPVFSYVEELRAVVDDQEHRRVFDIEVVAKTDTTIEFKLTNEIVTHRIFDYHTVEYKGDFEVAMMQPADYHKFATIVERTNSRERNNIAKRLKGVLSRDDIDNPELVTFLIDMNSKLDEVLSYLRPKELIEGVFDVRFSQLSSVGFTFYSPRDLSASDKIFMTAVISDDSSRLNFASICSCSSIRLNNDGSGMYIAEFLDMSDEVRDSIVRYVFSLEREQLKGLKRRND